MLVVALSLLSALFFAAAATTQQRATRVADAARPEDEPVHDGGVASRLPVVGLIDQLRHSPLWFIGWVVNLAGFLTQAVALHLGSVALVQPLLVTQLLFTLPMVTFYTHRAPLRRDWIAGLLICAGVALFLSVRGPMSTESPDRSKILLACFISLGVIVLLVVIAASRPPSAHAAEIAVAAGLCFALSAVLTKLTATDLVHRGIPATAVDWPGYALAASTLTGLLLEQEAFRSGALPIAVAGMTITNPIASYLIGVLAFGETAPKGAGGLAAIAGAAALLFLGAIGLAGSPTVEHDVYETTVKQGD